MFQLGSKSARGESSVAVSAALSAAHGTLAIVVVNLTSFRGGNSAIAQRKAAEKLQIRASEIQARFTVAFGDLHQKILELENSES